MTPPDHIVVREAIAFTGHHEGCYFYAYPDPASPLGQALGNKGIRRIGEGGQIPAQFAHLKGDPWTIGKGQTGPDIKYGTHWTAQQVDAALVAECTTRWEAIKGMVRVALTVGQAVALVSLSYNIGLEGLRTSTLMRRLNAGDYAGAAAQFDRWVFAKGQKLAGLVTRRACERALFADGIAASELTIIGGV